jgi:hypothetical protein
VAIKDAIQIHSRLAQEVAVQHKRILPFVDKKEERVSANSLAGCGDYIVGRLPIISAQPTETREEGLAFRASGKV